MTFHCFLLLVEGLSKYKLSNQENHGISAPPVTLLTELYVFCDVLSFVGYSMPYPVLYKWIVLFQTIQFSISTQFNSQAIQFGQAVLIQTIQFSIGIVFVYALLNVKQVPFQTIKLSVNTVSMWKTVLFQTFQLSIIMQFSSLWPTDRILSAASTSDQRKPGATAMKGYSVFQHYWSLTIRLFSVISWILVGVWVLPLCRDADGVFYSLTRLDNLPTVHVSYFKSKDHMTDKYKKILFMVSRFYHLD